MWRRRRSCMAILILRTITPTRPIGRVLSPERSLVRRSTGITGTHGEATTSTSTSTNINRNDFHFDKNNINNLNFDSSKFNFDRDSITNNIRENRGNRLDLRNNGQLGNLGGLAGAGLAGAAGGALGSRIQSSDVRRDVQNQLRQRDGGNFAGNRPGSRCKSSGQSRYRARSRRGQPQHRTRRSGQPPESGQTQCQPSRPPAAKAGRPRR